MIGAQLQRLRAERGLSLRGLATQAEVSPTLLSQIERGVTEPSLATLRKLAAVFGESIAVLFAEESAPAVWQSRPGKRSILRGPHGSIEYERLTPGNGRVEVLRTVLKPGQDTSAELWGHASLECAYVIAGELTVQVGETEYLVPAGESLTFEARQPHRYHNASAGPVEVLLSISPPIP